MFKRLLMVCSWLAMGMAGAQEAAAPAAPAAAPAMVNVVLHTALGDIHVALEKERAPVTVNNFLRYVDLKRYDGATFYRAVKVGDDGKYGLVQGGLKGNAKLLLKPIAHESPRVTGVHHLDGAISMARSDPGSATSDFFFVVGDLTSLDGNETGTDPGYAAFGHVTEGMEVVRQILDLPRDAHAGEGSMQGQMLAAPVKILSVRRAD